jgi:hypothetical protein
LQKAASGRNLSLAETSIWRISVRGLHETCLWRIAAKIDQGDVMKKLLLSVAVILVAHRNAGNGVCQIDTHRRKHSG